MDNEALSPKELNLKLNGILDGPQYAAAHKEETKKTITKYLKTNDPEILDATHRSFLQVTDYSAMPNI